jgi:hypothetical protein
MNRAWNVGFAASVSLIMVGGTAQASDQTTESLRNEIASLRAEIATLRQDDNWLNEQRADEIRGLVQDVLADADTRSSLMANGLTAGYDNGFMLGSEDGNFKLKINGQMQVRFNFRSVDDDGGSIDSTRWGFENTRTKLIFSGHVGSPQWMYYIEGDFGGEYTSSTSSFGTFTLQDAWIGYDMGNGWTLLMGQMKVPVLREWIVKSSNQLAIERSNVAYLSPAASRTQGVAVDYKADQWHFTVAYVDGAGTANTAALAEDTEFALAGRAEFLFQGNWDQFSDFSSAPGSETGILAGFGGHYQIAEYGTPTADELEVIVLTGDVSVEGDGWNVFGALIYQMLDDDATIDVDTFGFVVQGGMFFTDSLEGFARYEWFDFDTSGVDELSIITVGVNHYYGNNVKATVDVGFATDTVSGSTAVTGFTDDIGTNDGQIVIRSQLQLTF